MFKRSVWRTVKRGHEFKRIENHVYEINAESRADYDSLLKEIGAISETAQTIVHLWNVTRDEEINFEQVQACGFYCLVSFSRRRSAINYSRSHPPL